MARPGASRVGMLRVDPRGLVIGVAAAPERGRANAELVEAVARMAGVARSAVELVAGATAAEIAPDNLRQSDRDRGETGRDGFASMILGR